MRILRGGVFKRTDIWREGKWLDLWSVVHILSGVSVGLGFYFLRFDALDSVVLAFFSFVLYEVWEMAVRIKETPQNRFTDIVAGVAGFLPAFFLLAPPLSKTSLILAFGLAFIVNVVMSVFGWRASQKATALQSRVHARYVIERARLLERRALLRKRFRR